MTMNPPETSVPLDSIEWGFRQIDQDIRWLADSLAEVLSGLGEDELARWIPWASQADPALAAGGEPPARLGLALAMAFQLLNTVEERVSETLRERREESGSPEAERGLWADQLVELVRAGGTAWRPCNASRWSQSSQPTRLRPSAPLCLSSTACSCSCFRVLVDLATAEPSGSN